MCSNVVVLMSAERTSGDAVMKKVNYCCEILFLVLSIFNHQLLTFCIQYDHLFYRVICSSAGLMCEDSVVLLYYSMLISFV